MFIGNTGLGKTFLSNCIANELLKADKTILYQSASSMLDSIIDYKFGKENSSGFISVEYKETSKVEKFSVFKSPILEELYLILNSFCFIQLQSTVLLFSSVI